MKTRKPLWDTDVCMKQLYTCFLSDFHRSWECNTATAVYKTAFRSGSEYRLSSFPSYSKVGPHLFKWLYQIDTLYKRYIFNDDMFNSDELHKMTIAKFMATQSRISQGYQPTAVVSRVVREARRIISSVLQDYNYEEHVQHCRFGKKSDVGNSLRNAFLDVKCSSPISGTEEQIKWFKSYLLSDRLLLRAIIEAQVTAKTIEAPKGIYRLESEKLVELIRFEVCDTLKLVNVPKSYKSLRSIMPNTRIGVFYTNGLHGYLAEKLAKRAKLDIRFLQARHGELAKSSSIDGRFVTADLSAASDSLSVGTMRALLPSKWFRVFKLGRLNFCEVGDQTIRLESFMTMGIGFTFCLQTLVFYSLLRAIATLSGKPYAFVSVYGDDLIYHRSLHRYVTRVFPRLHLQLNEDKTYATGNFRESCGSDYHSGVDVRPFSIQGEHQLLTRNRYASFIYKLVNGFLRRWDAKQIPETLGFLFNQIVSTGLKIFAVPLSYPDDSGFKVDLEYESIAEYFCYVPKVHWLLPKYSCRDYIETVSVVAIQNKYPYRSVPVETIYLWDALRPKGEWFFNPWEEQPDVTVLHQLPYKVVNGEITHPHRRGTGKCRQTFSHVIDKGRRPQKISQRATIFW